MLAYMLVLILFFTKEQSCPCSLHYDYIIVKSERTYAVGWITNNMSTSIVDFLMILT